MDNTLLFWEDVIAVNWTMSLFAFVSVLIGTPAIWFYIVEHNSKFVAMVNVYGDDPETKWRTVVTRMRSTGIFLFADYSYTGRRWGAFRLISKFVTMAIASVIGLLWRGSVFLIPVVYLTVSLVLLFWRPYLCLANTILDIALYAGNTLFTAVPIIAYFGYDLPAWVVAVICILIFSLPTITVVVVCKCVTTEDRVADPTVIRRVRRQEEVVTDNSGTVEGADHKRAVDSVARDMDEPLLDDEFVLAESECVQENTGALANYQHDFGNGYAEKSNSGDKQEKKGCGNEFLKDRDEVFDPRVEFQELDASRELDEPRTGARDDIILLEEFNATNDVTGVGDELIIDTGMLDSTIDSIKKLEADDEYLRIHPLDDASNVPFIVSQRKLAHRITTMYEVLTAVIDGWTVELIFNVLNVMVIGSAACVGWYVGGLWSTWEDPEYHRNIVC